MSQTEHENLSALMDGELDSHQFRFLLRRMESHTSLHATWERYHLVGDSLRRETPVLAEPGLADRIMHEINAGSGSGTRRTHASHRWLRWSAGGAIAAGVAVAALVTIQPRVDGGISSNQPAVATAPVASSAHAIARTTSAKHAANEPMGAPSVPRWLSASPVAAQLAQPAAATFSPNGRALGLSEPSYGYDASGLAPYMTIPHAHGLEIRGSDQQAGHRWWKSAAPRHGWRLQAQ